MGEMSNGIIQAAPSTIRIQNGGHANEFETSSKANRLDRGEESFKMIPKNPPPKKNVATF